MDKPLDQHLYCWVSRPPFSTDPEVQPPELFCVTPETRPQVYLDGQLVNGRLRWCVSGDPGMADLYDMPDGKFTTGPDGRVAHTLHRGRVEVVPAEKKLDRQQGEAAMLNFDPNYQALRDLFPYRGDVQNTDPEAVRAWLKENDAHLERLKNFAKQAMPWIFGEPLLP